MCQNPYILNNLYENDLNLNVKYKNSNSYYTDILGADL